MNVIEKIKLRPPSQTNTRGWSRYSYNKKSSNENSMIKSADRSNGGGGNPANTLNLNKSNVSSNGSFANNSGYNCKNYEQYSEEDDNDNVLSDSCESIPRKKINGGTASAMLNENVNTVNSFGQAQPRIQNSNTKAGRYGE